MAKSAGRRRELLRAIARLRSQARLNEADALHLGRLSESRAWADVGVHLQSLGRQVHLSGSLAIQETLWPI